MARNEFTSLPLIVGQASWLWFIADKNPRPP